MQCVEPLLGLGGVHKRLDLQDRLGGSVLALMVTVLVWLFFLPLELNLTSISPCAPGAMGVLGH